MKTKIHILVFVILAVKCYSQFDYFKWTKTQKYATYFQGGFHPKTTGSGIAIDPYDRTFYVTNPYGLGRVYWNFGELLSSAPSADPTTNLRQLSDNAGDHLFYINNNHQIS